MMLKLEAELTELDTAFLPGEDRADRYNSAAFVADLGLLHDSLQVADRKHVASWNGYVISGLARASTVLGDASVLEDAVRAADFVLERMVVDGRLLRVHDGGRAHIEGFLDDHAAMLAACLDLQRAGAGERFLESAHWLAHEILGRFADRRTGALYLTPADGQHAKHPLIHRPRSEHDGATPDAAGLALLGLARLAALAESDRARGFRLPGPRRVGPASRTGAPRGSDPAPGRGPPQPGPRRRGRDRRPWKRRHPGPRRACAPGAAPRGCGDRFSARCGTAEGSRRGLVHGAGSEGGRATAYLCRGTSCSLPVQVPSELVAELVPEDDAR